jgi:type IV pilus assembly protein PilE
MKRKMLGVTLIELMIVIVVLAIIASIAVPSYRTYLIRSQRTEGTGALLQVQQAQEKFFLQNNRYADGAAELTAAPPAGLGLMAITPNNRYDVAIASPAPGTTYTATATPRAGGGQTGDSACQTFGINEQGVRTSGPNPITVCWK